MWRWRVRRGRTETKTRRGQGHIAVWDRCTDTDVPVYNKYKEAKQKYQIKLSGFLFSSGHPLMFSFFPFLMEPLHPH